MGDKTSIEWTRGEDGTPGATWNPVRGCREYSPGCDNCYAKRFAERWRGIPGHAYEAGFDPRTAFDQLEMPLRWKRSRTIFVNSMSDLFQGAFSNEEIAAVFGVMTVARHHAFQVLTKRSTRLRKWYEWLSKVAPGRNGCLDTPAMECVMAAQGVMGAERHLSLSDAKTWPRSNIWTGVSVEIPEYLPRIDDLRAIPAAVRFLSLEPLLADLGTIDLTGIHWVIAGGESGPGARQMHPDWVRSIRDQCAAAGVPFFFKQWGGLLKKKHGRVLDGVTHDAMPARAA